MTYEQPIWNGNSIIYYNIINIKLIGVNKNTIV